MTRLSRGLGLAATLAFISTLGVVPQAKAQSTAAYVYVQSQGAAGPVYGYNANTSGQLTAISGSPFKPGTQIVGGNGTQFFTLGHTLLHSWAVGSNGAIGSQLSDIAILNYSGGSCAGSQDGDASGVLDHTGKYIYLVLQNYEETKTSGTCQAIQSYIINSGGSFSFDGDTEQSSLENTSVGLPSILGNESYAYANNYVFGSNDLLAFKRESSGTLEITTYNETDPALSGGNYTPYYPDADPSGSYLVVQLYANNNTTNPPQLASYTVDSSGNIASTNTQSNMPTTQLANPQSVFSPDGTMVVFYSAAKPAGTLGNGIEIYNFNGASPLTLNTRFLNGTPIDQVAWDKSHHLYAISKSENKLWVFDVGASSIGQTATESVTSPVSLAVVSQGSGGPATCSPPVSDGISICAPSDGETTNSPVAINATAMVSGGVYRFEVWNGSTKLLSSDTDTINQSITLAPGTYKLTFDAYNSSKSSHEYAYRDITVQ